MMALLHRLFGASRGADADLVRITREVEQQQARAQRERRRADRAACRWQPDCDEVADMDAPARAIRRAMRTMEGR